MKFKEFMKKVTDTTAAYIKSLAKEDLENTDKKKVLDARIIGFIKVAEKELPLYLQVCVNYLLIPYVDDFTQKIYDLLDAKLN